jgi:signal transduction histidine kinase
MATPARDDPRIDHFSRRNAGPVGGAVTSMERDLRVLVVEDDPDDAELLIHHLTRCGYHVTHERVETASEMTHALARQGWELVVSDYSLPAFDARRALALFREHGLDCPFIIVSGTVDEETAVDAMRAGAHDFIAKGKLDRIAPLVARALQEAAGRAERRRMHEQLVVSERMASLGTLAAGVAHEINNPLAAIVANVEFAIDVLQRAQESSSEPSAADTQPTVTALLDPLRDTLEAALRVRDVTRDLKVFSRGDETRLGPVDVHAVLESSLRLARNEVRHRAQIVREYGEIPAVEANETRLGQVFLNLIVNAAQAIPEGEANRHEITVATRLETPTRVRVEVRDTGPGISDTALQRIFDPFFTTKPIGEGTGLGLAICHRIISSLGGEITVETQRGVGTAFRVSLPATTQTHVEPADALVPARGEARARRARILVVDDDAMVGAALRRALESDHDIVLCNRSHDALDHVSRGESFDLILCDLHMPEMTGMDLFRRLGRVAPDHAGRMVFMTGGAFTPAARAFLERVRQPRLDKPLDAAVLRRMIEELLS